MFSFVAHFTKLKKITHSYRLNDAEPKSKKFLRFHPAVFSAKFLLETLQYCDERQKFGSDMVIV